MVRVRVVVGVSILLRFLKTEFLKNEICNEISNFGFGFGFKFRVGVMALGLGLGASLCNEFRANENEVQRHTQDGWNRIKS